MTDTSYQLERDRANLIQQQALLNPLPDLPMRRNAVQDAQARYDASNDPRTLPERTAALQAAQRLLAEALEKHERSTQLGNQIVELTGRLELAQRRERQQAIDISNNRLAEAVGEYKHAALQAARAYRRILQANRLAHATPGASTTTPPAGFNIPHLAVDGGQTFTLGVQMSQGKMSWEQEAA